MLRFLVGLIIVLGLFCLVWTFLGENAFIWALLIGIAVGGLGLLFLPLARRGPVYAYQKWTLRMALLAILIVVAVFIAFLAVMFRLNVSPDVGYWAFGVLGVGMIVAAYTWGWSISPPTRRRGWLKRRYPAVAAALKRYERSGDVREYYNPALIIDGRTYFLTFYYANESPPRLSGALLLNENGGRVGDRGLVERAVRCKHLAIETIDYGRHQKRRRDIAGSRMAASGLRRAFRVLREHREEFSGQGSQNVADVDAVLGAEEAMIDVIEASIAMKLLEAEWTARHGLGRLTEVRYEDMLDLQDAMTEVRRPAIVEAERIMSVAEVARRLAGAVKGMQSLPNRKELGEGLLGIADSGEILKGETEVFRYAHFKEQDWQAWRERMAWADEVDARSAESRA